MKTKEARWDIISVLIYSLCFLWGGCKKTDIEDLPRISTDSITFIGCDVATCGGTITYFGKGELKEYGLCWNTEPMPTVLDSKDGNNTMNSDFRITIKDLKYNTTYYVRAYATNKAGTGYGDQLTFKTLEAKLNGVSTLDIKSVTKTTAICGGKFGSLGGVEILDWGVCWGTSQNPEKNGSRLSIKVGSDIFATIIKGLIPGTEYFVKAYVINKIGTGYGELKSFTTLNEKLPELNTSDITSITNTTTICGGNVKFNGGVPITECGVYWGTSPDPETTGTKLRIGAGDGSFSDILSGLVPGTIYFIRAYATNSFGEGYGPEVTFGTDGTITDVDGNTYNTIIFINRVEETENITSLYTRIYIEYYWTKENIRTTRYNDGIAIPLVSDNKLWTANSGDGYCWYDNDSEKYKDTYGALYNLKAVYNNSHNVCPAGWSISYSDYRDLIENFLGSDAGGKLKSVTGWSLPNTGATNESRFSALPGGFRDGSNGQFYGEGLEGYFSAPLLYMYVGIPGAEMRNYAFKLSYNNSSVSKDYYTALEGFSVRCSKRIVFSR